MILSNLPPCLLCSNADVKVYLDEEDQRLGPSTIGSSRTDVSPGRILRCQGCGFAFRQMRPGDEELSGLYRELDGKVYHSEFQGRSKTALRHLKIVHRYLSPGYILDVGCASGEFLRCAADAGWKTVGVEPSEALCEKAREVLSGRGELICATLEKACLSVSSFDAVTLWDVLEHVSGPLQFMRTCGYLLRPGGYLFVNVPDLDSLPARVFGARWPLFLAEHLNYFNQESLRLCGELARLNFLHSGRRLTSFSIDYLLHRLAQHHIPGASLGHRLASRCGISRTVVPLPMGELYGVWQRSS